MKYGLGVNANETVREIVEKSVEAERLGLDHVWVADVPSQRYGLVVASAIAANTKKLRIGLGLLSPFLHTPDQIANGFFTLVEAYGDRFELCIGPGDKDQLQRVGISIFPPRGISNYLLEARKRIVKKLRENKVRYKIWLGAQGPRILKIAKFFDGVLLNYASPNLIKWAISKIGQMEAKDFQYGVYAPSYIYTDFDEEVYNLLRVACAVVVLGASEIVLRESGLYEKLVVTKEKMKAGFIPESILNDIPAKTLDKFSIHMPSSELHGYLLELAKLGIRHIVFGYPQNFSKKTVRDLGEALP